MQRVSVVIPTYNRRALLERALSSVLSQTLPPYEVIVVDDGSTDDTASALQRNFPAVRCVQQDHTGVSAARNLGARNARGEWVAFLDSDDEWRPEKLELQMDALADSGTFCHTNEIWIRDGRRVNPMRKHAKYGGYIFKRCLPLCAISPSSVVMSRALFVEVGGFDEALPVCEDYDLWLRVCSRVPVVLVDEPLVIKYGGHADQLSRAYWGMDRFRIRALEKLIAGGRLSPADRAAAVETLFHKIDVFVQGARKRGKSAEAGRYEAIRRRFAETGQAVGP